MTFFRLGGQIHNHVCQVAPGYRAQKIINVGLFLTKLLKTKKVPSVL